MTATIHSNDCQAGQVEFVLLSRFYAPDICVDDDRKKRFRCRQMAVRSDNYSVCSCYHERGGSEKIVMPPFRVCVQRCAAHKSAKTRAGTVFVTGLDL